MKTLLHNVVIENVVQSKNIGKVAYQGYMSAKTALDLHFVKRYDDPSGNGYQRPLDLAKSQDFSEYLKRGNEAIFTPIYLNAAGEWEFSPYDRSHPTLGRLICKSKASLLDGQHRLHGAAIYTKETHSDFPIPFLVFHYLDNDEEIKIFNTINSKHKPLNKSISRYLDREYDDIAWISTQLLTDSKSPFFKIGSLTGRKLKGKHVSLQNMCVIVGKMTKSKHVTLLSREMKLGLVLDFFQNVRGKYPSEWGDYSNQKITHLTCLQALAIFASKILSEAVSTTGQVNHSFIKQCVEKLSGIDWSVDGSFKYLKGPAGAKTLANELVNLVPLDGTGI